MAEQSTSYQVVAAGVVVGEYTTESAAILAADKICESQSPTVRMVVRDGKYSSQTQVWPSLGPTYAR